MRDAAILASKFYAQIADIFAGGSANTQGKYLVSFDAIISLRDLHEKMSSKKNGPGNFLGAK
jgi:hypothetical protein